MVLSLAEDRSDVAGMLLTLETADARSTPADLRPTR
jgi:hypothetical protein